MLQTYYEAMLQINLLYKHPSREWTLASVKACWKFWCDTFSFLPHCLFSTKTEWNTNNLPYKLMLQRSKVPKHCLSSLAVQRDLVHCHCCTLNVTLTCAQRSRTSFWKTLLIEVKKQNGWRRITWSLPVTKESNSIKTPLSSNNYIFSGWKWLLCSAVHLMQSYLIEEEVFVWVEKSERYKKRQQREERTSYTNATALVTSRLLNVLIKLDCSEKQNISCHMLHLPFKQNWCIFDELQ